MRVLFSERSERQPVRDLNRVPQTETVQHFYRMETQNKSDLLH